MLKFIQILICVPAWLILLPLLVIPAIVLLILSCVRSFLDFIVTRWIHPGWTPIYPPDAVFANVLDKPYPGEKGSENCFGNYCSVITFAETITVEEIRSWYIQWGKTQIVKDENGVLRMSQVFERISRVPRQCLWYYYWAPVKIDWDKFIVEWNPGVESKETFDEYFVQWLPKKFVGNVLQEILIARPTSGKYAGKTVICSKVSHLVGDGVSTARELLGVGFGQISGSKRQEEIPKFVKTFWTKVLQNVVTFPWLFHRIIRLQRVPRLSELISNNATDQEVKMINIVDIIPLSSVKKISRALRIPLRVVLSCATMSAIRRLVLKKKILKACELPNEISCLVPIAWPYRRKKGFHPLGNNATSTLFLYPIKLDDPLERMEIAHKDFLENLQYGMHRMIYYATWLSYFFPAPLLRSSFFSQLPLSVNSVDCPTTEILDLPFLGKYSALPLRVVGVALPPDGNSFATDCIVVYWSNAKENLVTVSFNLNSRLIKDEQMGQELADCLKIELQELLYISSKVDEYTIEKDKLIAEIV